MEKLSLKFSQYLYWGVLGLFVFIPLYPKFPLFNIPGTYVAIRLEDFLITLVILWWFITIIPKLKFFLDKKITQAILVFWGIGALSLYSGLTVTHSLSPGLGMLHFARRVEFMSLFFVSLAAFKNFKQVKLWLSVMFLVTTIVTLYGFGQQLLRFPVVSTTNREFSKGLILYLTPDARVNSTFAGHYDLAVYLAFFMIVAASFFIHHRSIFKRAIIVTVSVLSFILLAMTAARVSFFAFLLGIVALLVLVKQKKLILVLILVSLLAFAVSPDLRHRTVATITVNLLGGGGAKYTPPPQKKIPTSYFSIQNAAPGSATPSGVPVDVVPGEPLNSTELGVFRSYGIRLDVEWPRAVRAFFKNPFLGTGYSSITIATDNDYLRALGETGLLGTLSLGLIFTIIIRRLWKFLKTAAKDQNYYLVVGVFCGLIALALNAFFIDVLESSKVAELLWLTLGVTYSAVKMKRA